MTTRLCTIDDCTDALYATGLCRLHYRRSRPRPADVLVEVQCDCCGEMAMKPARKQRYAHVYCSPLCRDYDRYGSTKCALPADHWAHWYGTSSDWTRPEPKRAGAFQCGTCSDCAAIIVEPATRSPSSYCSDTCRRRSTKRRRRARVHNAPGEFTHAKVIRQYRMQGYVCAYCSHPVNGLPDPEHVLPLSRGGRNDMSNIVAACRKCNSDKCDMTLSEWVEDRARRRLAPVNTRFDAAPYLHIVLAEPTRPAWRQLVSAG